MSDVDVVREIYGAMAGRDDDRLFELGMLAVLDGWRSRTGSVVPSVVGTEIVVVGGR